METPQGKDIRPVLINDKGTWAVRARVFDPVTGKTRNRSKSTGIKVGKDNRGKREAERIMKEIVSRWDAQSREGVPDDDPLFSEYIHKFLVKKSISNCENTALAYEVYARKWILPFFGKMKVRDIRLSHLELFISKVLETNSVSSVKKYFVIVNGALEEAKRDNIISGDFWKYVEFPRSTKTEKHILTPEQARQLVSAAISEGEPAGSAVLLGVCYGLRREEVCGLRWKDINFTNGELHIQNTVTQNGGCIMESERTKTDAGNRVLSMIPFTVPYLQNLKNAHIKQGIPLDKVCRLADGRPIQPQYVTRVFYKLLDKYGLPKVRFHDLRHTAASMLISKVPLFQVKQFLGHEDISTTANIYGSLLDSERKESAIAVNSFYSNTAICSDACSEQENLKK